MMYVYEAHAREGKLRIETVPSDDGITISLERFLAAIDRRDVTRALFPCAFQKWFFAKRKSITDRAHEVGAMVGARRLSVGRHRFPSASSDLEVDFRHRWFRSSGSVVDREQAISTCGLICSGTFNQRLLAGWLMKRLLLSTPTCVTHPALSGSFTAHPQFLHLYAAQSGYRIINEIGVERIRARARDKRNA